MFYVTVDSYTVIAARLVAALITLVSSWVITFVAIILLILLILIILLVLLVLIILIVLLILLVLVVPIPLIHAITSLVIAFA